jgi:F-type H+-transporting ATPase subunit a
MKMIINLFSIFDPSIRIMKLNWLIITTPIFFVQLRPFKRNKIKLKLILITKYLKKEINPILEKKNSPSTKVLIILFLAIINLNIISLLPHNFTITAQISFNLPIALRLWFRFLILGWIKKSKNIIAHLLPIGTPVILIPIIIIIELTSQIIRPITLSVRLTANIVAGHLLLSLLRSLSIKSKIVFISILPISLILTFLEICVSAIQAYVFITLITLYSIEIN